VVANGQPEWDKLAAQFARDVEKFLWVVAEHPKFAGLRDIAARNVRASRIS